MAGWSGTAPPREQVLAVATVVGAVVARGRRYPKARVWLLEDRTLVLCLPDKTARSRVSRERYEGAVVASVWDARNRNAKTLTVTLQGGDTVTVDTGCACGMGAAGNAGPTAGAYDVHRVRQPEWHTELK